MPDVYQIYWFYKNWAAVKKAKGIKRIYPFWRALFVVLFCWSLFKRIRHDAGKYGYKHQRSVHIGAFLFIGSYVGLWILDVLTSISPLPPPTFLLLIFLPLPIIALLIAQRAITLHNKHAIADYPKRKKLTNGDVVCIVVVCIWCAVSICVYKIA